MIPNRPQPMDNQYQPFHREAEALQNSFHSRLSDPFNPMAMMVKAEADRLVEDIAGNRHPQDVEARIRSIQGHLRRARDSSSGSSYMSDENSRYLQDRYSKMRHDLQELQQKPYFDQPRTPGPRGDDFI